MAAHSEINFKLIIKFIGKLLMILSGFMLLSTLWDFFDHQQVFVPVAISSLITFFTGFTFNYFTRKDDQKNIGKKEGYIIVTFTWISISLFGSLPFYLSGYIPSFTDAFFETISGFTTTGATILTDIEILPKSLLFWRSVTHWLGGMGIIVLTLAILPILGIGGMQLFVAEAAGTTATRLHPRITETAKRLWLIYVFFTGILTLLLLAGEMDLFEAINHAFSTMATGGFSTRNASIAAFGPYTHYVIILFMIIAGTNFGLLYFLLKGQHHKLLNNEEFRFYILLILGFTVIFTISLLISHQLGVENAFRDSLFQIVSIITTTGFITANYLEWSGFLWFLLFLLMFTGGCIGSTAGGMKMVRHLLLFKNSSQEFKRLVHPNALFPTRLDGKTIAPEIIYNFLAFFLLYIVSFMIGGAIMSMLGLDFQTALGATAASLGNVGPGIGSVGPIDNYAHIPAAGKWTLSFFMLIGRLELFTVLMLLTPSFWKR
jgi:trk system potassium uptake protein